jgi:DNA-binding CsgD family transcriptional regulator/PAS domain-containing protein
MHLLERAYDSAFEPKPFASLLAELSAVVGADAAHINMRVPEIGGELASSHEMPEQLIRSYREHHWRTDVWWHAYVRLRIPVGRPFTGNGIVPYRSLIKSEMYNDALRAYGLFDTCAGVLFHRGDAGAAVSLMRARGRPFYGKRETARLGAILPHMARAFEMRLRLDELVRQRDAFAAFIEGAGCGAFLVDAEGRVVHATDKARHLFGDPAGPLRIERARLRACSAAADRRLQLVLARTGAAAWPLEPSVIELPPAHCLRIAAVRDAGGLLDAAQTAFVIIVEPLEPPPRDAAEMAARRYGLTPAETELLRELVAGHSLAAAAERLSRTRTTARNQLQAIFAKTGTHRQAQLVVKILQ